MTVPRKSEGVFDMVIVEQRNNFRVTASCTPAKTAPSHTLVCWASQIQVSFHCEIGMYVLLLYTRRIGEYVDEAKCYEL